MDFNRILAEFPGQPITHQLLMSLHNDYKRPNDKIRALQSEGMTESIKKGLYMAGPKLTSSKPESALLANHIYWPWLAYKNFTIPSKKKNTRALA